VTKKTQIEMFIIRRSQNLNADAGRSAKILNIDEEKRPNFKS
jgi:hypothetical protein